MSTVNATIARTISAKSGMLLPASITPEMEFNLMDAACIVYHRLNEYKVAYDTLARVKDAVRDSGALVTLYADAKGEIAARCIWPNRLILTKDNALTCMAYCTLRKEYRSFRLDRMITLHELTTPADMNDDAEYEGSADFEDSYAARGRGLYG